MQFCVIDNLQSCTWSNIGPTAIMQWSAWCVYCTWRWSHAWCRRMSTSIQRYVHVHVHGQSSYKHVIILALQTTSIFKWFALPWQKKNKLWEVLLLNLLIYFGIYLICLLLVLWFDSLISLAFLNWSFEPQVTDGTVRKSGKKMFSHILSLLVSSSCCCCCWNHLFIFSLELSWPQDPSHIHTHTHAATIHCQHNSVSSAHGLHQRSLFDHLNALQAKNHLFEIRRF